MICCDAGMKYILISLSSTDLLELMIRQTLCITIYQFIPNVCMINSIQQIYDKVDMHLEHCVVGTIVYPVWLMMIYHVGVQYSLDYISLYVCGDCHWHPLYLTGMPSPWAPTRGTDLTFDTVLLYI